MKVALTSMILAVFASTSTKSASLLTSSDPFRDSKPRKDAKERVEDVAEDFT